MPTQDRNTGETTRQMEAAPQRAVYVWCTESTRYAVDLSRYLGRSDLEIVTSRWLDRCHWQGRELTGLVIDHACKLTHEQQAMLPYIRTSGKHPHGIVPTAPIRRPSDRRAA